MQQIDLFSCRSICFFIGYNICMEKLFNKNYIFTVISATLFYTASFMLNTVSARYSLQLGADKTVAGFVAAVFTLASFFTRPVWGYITDKKGRKRVYNAGGLLCLASTAILLFCNNVILLFVSRIIYGAGYSALTTAGGTIICDIVPEKQLSKAISLYGITNVLSQAVAPAAALWLFDKGFIWVAVTAAVIEIGVLVAALFVKYSEEQYINPDISFRIIEKTALPAAYTIVFFAVSTASINSFIPVMAQERGINGDKWFFVLSALFLLLSRFINTKVTDRYGKVNVFCKADILYTIAFALIAFTYDTLLLLLASVMYGLGAGFIHPIVNTAAVSRCGNEKRGLATGTFMMSQDLGMTIGAAAWGVISETIGFTAVYLMVAALLLVMLYVFRSILAPVLE